MGPVQEYGKLHEMYAHMREILPHFLPLSCFRNDFGGPPAQSASTFAPPRHPCPACTDLHSAAQTVPGPARTVLGTAEATAEAARSGRTGPLRVTAGPVWVDAIVPPAIARFREAFPGIELRLDTATRAEELRLLATGETDLHCGGVDTGEPLPGFLRRQRFVDLTAGIVAGHDHPLHTRVVTFDDLARCPWIDYDAAANIAPSDPRPSLPRLLVELCERTATGVEDVIRTGSAGLLLMTTGPYLAWLALNFLERLPGVVLRPVPVTFGRFRYRSGIIARRSAEDLPPFRHLEALVRDAALGALGAPT